MTNDDVTIRLGLKGQQETSRGLKQVAADERRIGTEADHAAARAKAMGATFKVASRSASAGLAAVGTGAKWGAAGLAGLTVAGAKWGLGFNSQVEQARLRFRLFTTDVNGLTDSVKAIDKASMFNFADLADAAALLGGSGIKDVPKTLQAAANAAAGGGKGTEGLKSIVLALSQIQSKGRLSQEEINQLTEGGAITAQRDLAQGLGLTAKQLQNVGGQGIEANKALDVLTKSWTSGEMAGAAQRQLGTLQGQWGLFTGNMQKLAGLATQGLTMGLEKNVIPASNRAVEQITAIFGDKGLTNQQKLRQARDVIRRELGPVANDIIREIKDADLAGKLSSAFESSLNKMASVAAHEAPHVVKAFVDAWLGAGPWAKLITGGWLAHKLGIDKGALVLLKSLGGKGGGGGPLGKVAGLKPVPVYVTNWGGGGGGANKTLWDKFKTGAKDVGKVLGPAALAVKGGQIAGQIGTAAEWAGAAGLGDVGMAAPPVAFLTWLALTQGHHNFPSRAGGGSVRQQAASQIPAPGFGGGMPGLPPGGLKVQVTIDGRVAGEGVDRAKAKTRARK